LVDGVYLALTVAHPSIKEKVIPLAQAIADLVNQERG
jgi:hypothetical protein